MGFDGVSGIRREGQRAGVPKKVKCATRVKRQFARPTLSMNLQRYPKKCHLSPALSPRGGEGDRWDCGRSKDSTRCAGFRSQGFFRMECLFDVLNIEL